MKMTLEFVLERLEVIGGSAHERESGNELEARMLAYLRSHKIGNEEAIRKALERWVKTGAEPKAGIAGHLLALLGL